VEMAGSGDDAMESREDGTAAIASRTQVRGSKFFQGNFKLYAVYTRVVSVKEIEQRGSHALRVPQAIFVSDAAYVLSYSPYVLPHSPYVHDLEIFCAVGDCKGRAVQEIRSMRYRSLLAAYTDSEVVKVNSINFHPA